MKLTITSSNGKTIDYIYGLYRTEYPKKKLYKQVCSATEEFGQYIYIGTKDIDTIAVCFSQDKGILLAESIASYLGNPRFLVYIEKLTDEDRYIVVTIDNFHVVLDDIVTAEELKVILEDLDQEAQTEVKYFGFDLKAFYFKSQLTQKVIWSCLENSIIKSLVPSKKLMLKSHKTALAKFWIMSHPIILSIICIIIILLIIYCSYSPSPQKQFVPPPPPPVDHYSGLKQALSSSDIVQTFASITRLYKLSTFLSVNGSKMEKITFSNNSSTMTLDISNMVPDANIDKFATDHNMVLKYLSNSAITLQEHLLINANHKVDIMKLIHSLSQLMSNIHQYLNCNEKLGKFNNFNYYQSQEVQISCHDVSTDFIRQDIVSDLALYPIAIKTLEIKPDNLLVNLDMDLVVYGI
ncbi:hypothetical protein [Cysteiniphilum halobium]|uniref:hypothetical protein n=1 Tax=Cysteiniphilum halobium TaxID=2219059 RepID=UPI000E64DE9B|nr:hypothetical protein [Cysteiniphilum halobium]